MPSSSDLYYTGIPFFPSETANPISLQYPSQDNCRKALTDDVASLINTFINASEKENSLLLFLFFLFKIFIYLLIIIIILYICIFFFFGEREGGHELGLGGAAEGKRISSRLCTGHGAQCGALSPDPEMMI